MAKLLLKTDRTIVLHKLHKKTGREIDISHAPSGMVGHIGFEPMTSGSGDQCSIQLS